MSDADRTAGEIDWPTWLDRTTVANRTRTAKFGVTLAQAIDGVEQELDRVGVDDWRLSTAAPHRKSDGRPYADANPDDPAAVVRWSKGGEQYCVACDQYTRLRDNVRAIGLYIGEKRKMSNRPVETGQDEFATARLPPAGGAGDVIVADHSPGDDIDGEPHEVLQVAPDASEEIVRAAFVERVKEAHPDQGGSSEEMERVRRAKEAMLDE